MRNMPGALGALRGHGDKTSFEGGTHIRLGTLVTIRWIAILGQLSTILTVHYLLGFEVDIVLAGLAVAASALINLALTLLYPASRHLTDPQAAMQLGFDLVQLSLLLFLTGGMTNPFAILMVVPVTISATVLSRRSTWILLGIAFVASVILAVWHLPLPVWEVELYMPRIYLIGSWAGLAFTMIFLSLYAGRVSADARRRAQALAATEAALEREHKLSELGTLAAAAAHELGTPLGTITLAARELMRDTPTDDVRYEDISLINDQVTRCRRILERLSTKDLGDEEHPFAIQTIEALAREAARQFDFLTDVTITVTATPLANDESEQPLVTRRAEILHALTNFVENAVGFAKSEVTVEIGWSPRAIRVVIADDGPGFDPVVQKQLGEPYVTTRRDGMESDGSKPVNATGDTGLGLGVFIAKTLLERTGATVRFVNGIEGGAIIRINWKRDILEEAL